MGVIDFSELFPLVATNGARATRFVSCVSGNKTVSALRWCLAKSRRAVRMIQFRLVWDEPGVGETVGRLPRPPPNTQEE